MIIDTEVGGEYSNSYITVVEADEILMSIGMEALPWLDAETTLKEYTLVIAANFIGMLPLRGRRVAEENTDGVPAQALDFPRDCQVVTDELPDVVKEAQAILAATVVYDNITNLISKYTDETPDGYTIESLIQSGAIESISVGGVFSVKLHSGSSSSFGVKKSISDLSAIPYIFGFPVYMRLKPYLSQFRGGVVGD